jgi:glycosyltransferase involved in cell wall biosynthesis
MTRAPRVLQVTGAYEPEIGAAGIQCRAVAAALNGRAVFSVLTTAVDPALPVEERIDGVAVHRIAVDVGRPISKMTATARLVARLIAARTTFDIVHLHGVSQKNVPISGVARLLGKRLVITLHTAGQDEPEAVRRRGRTAYRAFTSADITIAVSPYMTQRYRQAGLPEDRLRLIPNGIDTVRFRPASPDERQALRRTLGWSDAPVIVFVGFFSRDKQPDLLFRAWRRLVEAGTTARLVFVGATRSAYYEIDASIERDIRAAAGEMGAADAVVFTGPTHDVPAYLRAADLFVLPSIRETQSLALLEAMACGLPVIASRLEGATDTFVDDRRNGRLISAGDEVALADALREMLAHSTQAWAMGACARETIVERYAIERTAEAWLNVYARVLEL